MTETEQRLHILESIVIGLVEQQRPTFIKQFEHGLRMINQNDLADILVKYYVDNK